MKGRESHKIPGDILSPVDEVVVCAAGLKDGIATLVVMYVGKKSMIFCMYAV